MENALEYVQVLLGYLKVLRIVAIFRKENFVNLKNVIIFIIVALC